MDSTNSEGDSSFMQIAKKRQSCRDYDPSRQVEKEKILKCLEAARLSPSACNGQPYHFYVVTGEKSKQLAPLIASNLLGMNTFCNNVPCFIVITEDSYNLSGKIGSVVKGQDYRLEDIGIATAYLTSEATCQGLDTCIMGWFDQSGIQKFLGTSNTIRLVIAVGYCVPDYSLRRKKRKTIEDLVTFV